MRNIHTLAESHNPFPGQGYRLGIRNPDIPDTPNSNINNNNISPENDGGTEGMPVVDAVPVESNGIQPRHRWVNLANATVLTGHGGSSIGARGGDIGANDTTFNVNPTTGSLNQVNGRQLNAGDTFHGTILNGFVGGRNNRNTMHRERESGNGLEEIRKIQEVIIKMDEEVNRRAYNPLDGDRVSVMTQLYAELEARRLMLEKLNHSDQHDL